jgi:hypothetical protein
MKAFAANGKACFRRLPYRRALLSAAALFAATNNASAFCIVDRLGSRAECFGPVSNQDFPVGFNAHGLFTTVDVNSSVQGTTVGISSDSGDVVNNGRIVGGDFGLVITDSGFITIAPGASIEATNNNGVAISSVNFSAVTNAGSIIASASGGIAINSPNLIVINSGSIAGDHAGIVSNSALITNSGSISAANGTAVQSLSNLTDLTNSGTITGGTFGSGVQSFGGASITNSGTISGDFFGVQVTGRATITNSGIIEANIFGVFAGPASSIVNSGTISGKFGGISVGPGSSVTNSGTVISTLGPAISFGGDGNTLTLNAGSHVFGTVDMSGNNNKLVFGAGPSRAITVEDGFNAVISGAPAVRSGNQISSIDVTGATQATNALNTAVGSTSSVLHDHLNDTNSGIASPGSNAMAMAYAPENARAQMFTKASVIGYEAAPILVWSNVFGGGRVQDATDQTLRAATSAFGGVIGVDRKLRPGWLVGVFAGGGSGKLSVEFNSQTVDTDYGFGGIYSRFEWGSQFVDLIVQGGVNNNRSRRLIENGAVAGGFETATASYNGSFISPELSYGYRLNVGDGYVLTPTARVRYVAGFYDAYSETGSSQNLSIGAQTVQGLEERGELYISKATSLFSGAHLLKTAFHGGVIGVQRVGNSNVDAVLAGQSLTFATPGTGAAVGAVAGFGFEYQANARIALFGSVEGFFMSDSSRTGIAKAGARAGF